MNKLLLTLLSSIILGCSTAPDIPAISVKNDPVNISIEHLTPCEPLIVLSPNETELDITIRNFEIFAKCKKKQDNSIILLKQFSNYKEPIQ